MSNARGALVDALAEAAGMEPGEFFESADQLDLLSDDAGHHKPGSLKLLRDAARKRGVGRPRGSRNKRTQQLADWFVHQFGDPMAVLGEIMSMPVDVLYQQMVLAQGGESKEKKVTGKDALRLKVEAAKEAMPYVHGKKPIEVDLKSRPDAVIFIPGLNAPDGDSKVMAEAVEKLGIGAIQNDKMVLIDGREVGGDDLREAEDDGGEAQ